MPYYLDLKQMEKDRNEDEYRMKPSFKFRFFKIMKNIIITIVLTTCLWVFGDIVFIRRHANNMEEAEHQEQIDKENQKVFDTLPIKWQVLVEAIDRMPFTDSVYANSRYAWLQNTITTVNMPLITKKQADYIGSQIEGNVGLCLLVKYIKD